MNMTLVPLSVGPTSDLGVKTLLSDSLKLPSKVRQGAPWIRAPNCSPPAVASGYVVILPRESKRGTVCYTSRRDQGRQMGLVILLIFLAVGWLIYRLANAAANSPRDH